MRVYVSLHVLPDFLRLHRRLRLLDAGRRSFRPLLPLARPLLVALLLALVPLALDRLVVRLGLQHAGLAPRPLGLVAPLVGLARLVLLGLVELARLDAVGGR